MSLSEQLAELRKPVANCAICRWYNEQSGADRAEFDACITSGVPSSVLLEVCHQHGLDAQISSFRNHRKNHHGKATS